MSLIKSFLCILLFSIPSSIVFAQYTAYQTSFQYVTSCPIGQYFDVALLQCSACPNGTQQNSNDVTKCDCNSTSYYYGVNQGGGSLICLQCNTNYVRSIDGFGCTLQTSSCDTLGSNNVLSEAQLDGSLYNGTTNSSSQPRIGSDTCVACQNGTWPEPNSQRCTPCASVTPLTSAPTGPITCCTASQTSDGICIQNINSSTITISFSNLNRFSNPTISAFFQRHYQASFYLCRMNLNLSIAQSPTRLLLSNATACQVLGNIAAMQYYYGVNDYAFYNYDTYLWNPTLQQIWKPADARPSIPFLQYPTTYYTDISSSTYNWIPASFNQNDLVRLRLAKYSSTGQFLGLVDAYDTYMQLCGGGYTNGQAAFTFGTEYQQSCFIRADALWNSTLYETAFFDPYIVFTQSGSDSMLPIPVVFTDYQTKTGTFPNQDVDASKWTYHRRFFLLDRISGVATNNVLASIHYAKSITILNTLTNGGSYIQPPVIVIDYGELTSSDIGKGSLIQISFTTSYQMNLDDHIRNIWIAVGVLSGLGLLLAFARTTVWQSRAGKDIIDLVTIGKLIIFSFNILATVFFIVMAGVSLWWLIFFKRQDSIYLVIPTAVQQTSFTALVCVAFSLKTIDILHLIFRQGSADIFFIDWEKPKAGFLNTVSVWRTYFVANEFHEIQTFRRINPTFQLFFVLFLLKVINLENVATAQPGVNLFPSSSDYKAEYNGILRVGIAFSMWLATALVQYLFYVLFYQRFIEDKIINFIDLCSVSNISVLLLTDNQYGYYIHGRSPHGATDVNMRDMIMNLERESKQMSGTRGLEPKSDEQTFIVRLDRKFRLQYEDLLKHYQNRIAIGQTKKVEEQKSEILMQSYRNLNEFLCAFINHSLPSHNYVVRNRTFPEKVFNYEFTASVATGLQGQIDSIFFVDMEKNFTRAMFAGHENSLFIWNMAIFLFIDYFAFNYVLAAIITYIFNKIAISMRLSLGRKNLAAKTLIPKNFLI